MHSGVVNVICDEIDGGVTQYVKKYKDLVIVLTRGGASFLIKQ